MQELYWQHVQSQLSRLLSLQDREPASAQYGSFDRKHWHQRFTDFPSASLQQGVETLALLYELAPESSPYRHNPQLLEWVEAGVLATSRMQNRDGSFDEWYLGERGWAGPTAYILNSLFEAHHRTGERWRDETRNALRQIFQRATPFLSRYEERDVLANHQALALVTLYQSHLISPHPDTLNSFEKLWARFLKGVDTTEGWSLEYDGADPGYQTATLSFLARLDRVGRSKSPNDSKFEGLSAKLEELVQSQLRFLSHFVFPGGSFADGLGSRGTSNVFFFGFEYWSRSHPLAARIALELHGGLKSGRILRPADQEDHYLIYRLPEFLLAMEAAGEGGATAAEISLPWQQPGYKKHFKNSAHYFYRNDSHYAAIYLGRGGMYRVYDIESGNLAASDYGVWMQEDARVISSAARIPPEQTQVRDGELSLTVPFVRQSLPVFRPLTFLLFKTAFLLSAWHPRGSAVLKSLIRKKLMFSGRLSGRTLQRRFELQKGQIRIINRIEGGDPPERVFRHLSPSFRFVPQSRYFQIDELRVSQPEIRGAQWEETI